MMTAAEFPHKENAVTAEQAQSRGSAGKVRFAALCAVGAASERHGHGLQVG